MRLQLPKTKIDVNDGSLRKRGPGDEVIAEIWLNQITGVRAEKRVDLAVPVTLIAVFVGLAVVSRYYIPSAGWGWAAAIVFLGLAAFCCFMTTSQSVVIDTKHGSLEYAVADADEDAGAFVVALRQYLQSLDDNVLTPDNDR